MRSKILVAALALLNGCYVAPVAPYALNPNPPPPPVRAETIPPPPVSEEAQSWQPGHWDFDGHGGYLWREGQWVARAGHGAQWLDGYWADQGGVWTWVPAHWV